MTDLDRVVQGTLFGESVLSASVAALLADEDGHYVAANDAVCRLTGFTREHLTAARMGSLAADEESARIYTNVARGRELEGRKRILCEDGAVKDCRYWAISCRVSRVPYFLLLLWDAVHVSSRTVTA